MLNECIDLLECNHNIITSGLPEEIIMENYVSSPIINVYDKIFWILRYMVTAHFDEDMINNFNIP